MISLVKFGQSHLLRTTPTEHAVRCGGIFLFVCLGVFITIICLSNVKGAIGRFRMFLGFFITF